MKTSEDMYGFATFFKEDGQYYFQFNDEDGTPILFSHGYQTEKSRDNGIQSIMRYANDENLYERKKTKKGKSFFILKAANHQEIGRSRMFESEEEMEEKIALLLSLKKDAPIYETTEAAVAKAPPEKKSQPLIEPALKQEEDEMGNMPRYKFTIIYYPDSDIWTLKHDFSENSIQLKTCDGAKIEAFLQSRVPKEKRRKTSVSSTTQSRSKDIPVRKAIPEKYKQPQSEELEMNIRNINGELVNQIARAGAISQIELILKTGTSEMSQHCWAKVLARSLADNETIILGEVKDHQMNYGRLLIPVTVPASRLKPGMYRFTATMHQGEKSESFDVSGSRLVMLN